MADPFFKVSDVKSLKELAHVLTYPLIAVAYFLQSGANVGWEGKWQWGIPENMPLAGQYFLFFLYFTLKAIWVCAGVAIVDVSLTRFNWEYSELVLLVASIVFIGIGLLGLVAPESHPLLARINKFWFFACFVWGFACSGRLDSGKET